MFGLGDLFLAYGQVEELEFSDEFLAHLRERATYPKHNVTLVEIVQTHQARPKYFLNEGPSPAATDPSRPARPRAPIVMLGPTATGRVLTVPLDHTDRFGIWRPRTAFESNQHHRTRYLEGVSR